MYLGEIMSKNTDNKHVLKAAGILLITAAMICSSTAVATTTPSSSQPVVPENNSNALSEVILEEGFEDGTMPPEGWTHQVYNTDETWKIVTDPIHSGTYAAHCGFDSSEQDEFLISPLLDLSTYVLGELRFWVYSRSVGSSYWHCELEINGEPVWDVRDEEEWLEFEWREMTIDLTPYCGDSATIGWHYWGRLGQDFVLDDVIVEGRPSAELELSDLTGGWRGFGLGGAVSAVITDTAEGEASDVQWNITLRGNGVLQKLNYSDNGTIPTINGSGGSETIQYEGDKIFGLSFDINLTIRVSCAEGSTAEVSKKVFIIGPFVIVPKA
jgi:hypothetical protein